MSGEGNEERIGACVKWLCGVLKCCVVLRGAAWCCVVLRSAA